MKRIAGILAALIVASCQTTPYAAQVPSNDTITVPIAGGREAARTALLLAFEASGAEVTHLPLPDSFSAMLEAAGAEARVYARIEEGSDGVRVSFEGWYRYVSYLAPGRDRHRTHELTSTCRGTCAHFWQRMGTIAAEVGGTELETES